MSIESALALESGFSAVCATICLHTDPLSLHTEAPLRGRMHLRSQIRPGFQANDFTVLAPQQSDLPTLEIAFLTLAGGDGALPWWITEKILLNRQGQGEALHRFLDLFNRRFWELLFLAQCAGNNPHYGIRQVRHEQLLSELSAAVAGLKPPPQRSAAVSHSAFLQRLKQQCWAAGHGAGGAAAFAEMLTEVCGNAMAVRQHVPLRLAVAQRARLFLGPGQAGRLSASSGILGAKAWVVCGLAIAVVLRDERELAPYLPLPGSPQNTLLLDIAEIFYAHSLPPLTLQLNCPVTAAGSRLGHMRLGWGAAVANPRPASHLIHLSRRANQLNRSCIHAG